MILLLAIQMAMSISAQKYPVLTSPQRESSYFVIDKGYKKEATAYFNHILDTLQSVHSPDSLLVKLNTLKSKFISSRSFISSQFNRDVDFDYRHQRIDVTLNMVHFQIDLITKGNVIVLSSIKTDYYSNLTFKSYDKSLISKYLDKRSDYYGADRSVNLLFKELTRIGVYGLRCGYGPSDTDEIKRVKYLVVKQSIRNLRGMLQSVDCETQAYGVAGFEMLKKNGVKISSKDQLLVDHIMKRNSPLRTCSGCMIGSVNTIY